MIVLFLLLLKQLFLRLIFFLWIAYSVIPFLYANVAVGD